MNLDFEKWQGAGNDFIVLWLGKDDDQLIPSLERQAPQICGRSGLGVGADGIIAIHAETRSAIDAHSLTIINSDGSRAATCGNGIRCAALSIYKRHQDAERPGALPEGLDLLVEGRNIMIRFLARASGPWPYVAVTMGSIAVNQQVPWFAEVQSAVNRAKGELSLPDIGEDIWAASLPNDHVVISDPQASAARVRALGPWLQDKGSWDGINVHLFRPIEPDKHLASKVLSTPIDDAYEVFVWERGAGETLACGSGACAVAAAAFAEGDASRESWVSIRMPGGTLFVQQPAADDPVVLAGPAGFVFSGTLPF